VLEKNDIQMLSSISEFFKERIKELKKEEEKLTNYKTKSKETACNYMDKYESLMIDWQRMESFKAFCDGLQERIVKMRTLIGVLYNGQEENEQERLESERERRRQRETPLVTYTL